MPPWVCTVGYTSLGGYSRFTVGLINTRFTVGEIITRFTVGLVLLPSSRFTVGLGLLLSSLSPFHCWANSPVFSSFPFHCWLLFRSLLCNSAFCDGITSLLSPFPMVGLYSRFTGGLFPPSFSRFTVGLA